MTALYSIILAGGSGCRLWPVSREMFPKQLFKIDDEYSLFQRTFLNIASIVDDKNIITSTSVKYVSSMKEQLKELQNKFCRKNPYSIVSEPLFKNTAASIALAAKYIDDNLSNSIESPIIIVVPSDHIVFNRVEFFDTISKGVSLAKNGYIVSFGTLAESIDENFGYIKVRRNQNVSDIEPSAFKAIKFIEKPNTKDKKSQLKGKFYLNSGMYMFSLSTLFTELKKYSPEIYRCMNKNKITNAIPSIQMNEYEKLPDISIDYVLMEKSKKLVTVPLNTYWSDVGSWSALYNISKKNRDGNVFTGKTIDIGSKNSIVYSTSKLTATMGLDNSVVVETDDAVLVSDMNSLNSVKDIYKKLNGKNLSKKEIHKTVYRPWGYYTVLENGNGFLTKCITVNPNAKLSVQRHYHRSEHWIILEGNATVIKGDKVLSLNSGESIDIDVEEVHSLQNMGDEQLKVLEVQQGDILDENDIERLEDIYGRV